LVFHSSTLRTVIDISFSKDKFNTVVLVFFTRDTSGLYVSIIVQLTLFVT